MIKRITKEQIEVLPKAVRNDIYETLKCYDKVYVSYEFGRYNVDVGIGIKSKYADDHEFIGTVYVEDVYTSEEQRKNYEETFKCHTYGRTFHSNID